jgi:hypothetical protein
MQEIYANSIDGKCSVCKCDLDKGGYIYLAGNNSVRTLLCPPCKEFQDDCKLKKGKLVVKRLTGFLNWQKGWYQVKSATNLVIKKNLITEAELTKLVDKDNIEVIITT